MRQGAAPDAEAESPGLERQTTHTGGLLRAGSLSSPGFPFDPTPLAQRKSQVVKSTVHLSGLHCIFEVGHPHCHNELPTLALIDKSKHGVYLNGGRP